MQNNGTVVDREKIKDEISISPQCFIQPHVKCTFSQSQRTYYKSCLAVFSFLSFPFVFFPFLFCSFLFFSFLFFTLFFSPNFEVELATLPCKIHNTTETATSSRADFCANGMFVWGPTLLGLLGSSGVNPQLKMQFLGRSPRWQPHLENQFSWVKFWPSALLDSKTFPFCMLWLLHSWMTTDYNIQQFSCLSVQVLTHI